MEKEQYAFCITTNAEYTKKIAHQYNNNCYLTYTFWGNEALPAEFWNSIGSQSLLSKPKLVILRNAHKIAKEDYLAIERYLLSKSEHFCLFSIEQENIPSYITSSHLYTKAKEHGQIHKEEILTKNNIIPYIKQYCKEKGYTITQDAILYIKDILPCVASAIHNECTKYMLYAEDNNITLDIVQKTTSYVMEETIWKFIAMLFQEGNLIQLWDRMKEHNSFFTVSVLLQRELRIAGAILCKDSLSLPSYSIPKKEKIAKKLGYKGIVQLLLLLRTMENNIKSGEITEEQALEYIICTIPYSIHKKIL